MKTRIAIVVVLVLAILSACVPAEQKRADARSKMIFAEIDYLIAQRQYQAARDSFNRKQMDPADWYARRGDLARRAAEEQEKWIIAKNRYEKLLQ